MAFKNFVCDWNVPLSEIESLVEKQGLSAGKFVTSCDAVVYEWIAHIVKNQNDRDMLTVYLQFLGGCAASIDDVAFLLQLNIGPTKQTYPWTMSGSYSTEYNKGAAVWGGASLRDWQEKYRQSDAQSLTLRFVLKIPDAAFKYSLKFPFVKPAQQWVEKQFEDIEKPPSLDDGVFSDMQVEASDGHIFYVNKVFFQYQSKALAVIIHMDAEESNRVTFPTLDSEALRALIKFLYLGMPYGAQNTRTIISLLDAAEQYELPVLKDMCCAALWNRVVDQVSDAPEIMRAADTYQLKALKMRTVCILVDNYEKINVDELSKSALRDIAAHAIARNRCCRVGP